MDNGRFILLCMNNPISSRLPLLSITITQIINATEALSQQGTIKGTLFDTAAKEAVPDAAIFVLDAKDSSLVTFTRSNFNGTFEMKYLDYGNYRLLITNVAYPTRWFVETRTTAAEVVREDTN